MRPKKFDYMLQVRVTCGQQAKLQQAALRTGLNVTELIRQSLRLGLSRVVDKLSPTTEQKASGHE
jgi:hypothetical protein